MLALIAEAARERGRPVSVCGEAASNVDFLPRLVGLGLRSVSVSPRFIPELRKAARQLETAGCGTSP